MSADDPYRSDTESRIAALESKIADLAADLERTWRSPKPKPMSDLNRALIYAGPFPFGVCLAIAGIANGGVLWAGIAALGGSIALLSGIAALNVWHGE